MIVEVVDGKPTAGAEVDLDIPIAPNEPTSSDQNLDKAVHAIGHFTA